MEMNREQMEAVVVSLLGPYLGESMARASVLGHCRNLSIEGPTVGTAQMERLVEQLRKGMMIFVGAEKAEALATALRRQLHLGESS